MTDNWKYLPTFQDVAEAQAQGWEIEYRHMNKEHWQPWNHTWWNEDSFFHARPRQPKMKKVKMLAWFTGSVLCWVIDTDSNPSRWIRIPSEDKEIEVPE